MHVIDLIDHFSQLNHSRNSQITMHAGQCRISSKRDWQIHLDVQKSSKTILQLRKLQRVQQKSPPMSRRQVPKSFGVGSRRIDHMLYVVCSNCSAVKDNALQHSILMSSLYTYLCIDIYCNTSSFKPCSTALPSTQVIMLYQLLSECQFTRKTLLSGLEDGLCKSTLL